MCGIAGIYDKSTRDKDWLIKAQKLLSHRGPDDSGYLSWNLGQDFKTSRDLKDLSGELGFVHNRLAIIDLSDGGWQPQISKSRNTAMIYNGEIYNYLELKKELIELGRTFTSQSDSEVLLEGFEEWGVEVFKKLIGMFALAVVDRRTQELVLARDFFGIKPLYYCESQGRFAFASEIKTLLELPGVTRLADPDKVYNYLRYNLSDHDESTFFSGIRQVEAGHYLKVQLPNLRKQSTVFYKLAIPETLDISFEDATQRVRKQFLRNIELHMRSDVEVGVALSGGIDSSSIVGAIRHLYPKRRIHAFSFVSEDASTSEEKWIDEIAKTLTLDVTKVRIKPSELREDIDELVDCEDVPFGSTSMYAQYRVFKAAKAAGIKVMLDGQGADEIFAGYPHFLSARLARLIAKGQWIEASRVFINSQGMLAPHQYRYLLRAFGFLTPKGFNRLVTPIINPYSSLKSRYFRDRIGRPVKLNRSKSFLKTELLASLTRTSLPMLLRYEDRNSMTHSIESRVPFLTPNMVQLAYSLPDSYLISQHGETKHVLRAAMTGLVPSSVLTRKDKIGFATPERYWLSQLKPWVDEVLNKSVAHQMPFLKHNELLKEWDQIISGKRAFDFRTWRWINLIVWSEKYGVRYE